MDTINFILSLLIIAGLLFISYRIGRYDDRRHADQILGFEHRKALKRIKNQAERNN